MSRLIIISLTIIVVFLAGLSGNVSASTAFEDHYSKGLDLFYQKRFNDARDELFLAMALQEGHADTIRHLALASFMVKDYPLARNLAAQYLDQKQDADILVIMGRASELNGDLELASGIYNQLANSPNQHQRAAREALNRLVKENQSLMNRPEGFHGVTTASFEHDDNIATTYDEILGLPSSTSDSRVSVLFAADYDTPVKDNYFVGLGGLVFGNIYEDVGQPYELAMLRGNFHSGMVGKGWSLKSSIEYDYVEYGHEKEFSAARLAANLVKIFSNRFAVLVQGSVANEDWSKDKSDSVRYDIAADGRVYFPGISPETYLRLKIQHQYNHTDETSTQAYYFDKGTLSYKTSLSSLAGIYILPSVSYEKRIYREPMPISREDHITEYSLALGKNWTKALSTEAQYRYTETNSNINLYDKSQRVFGLSMSTLF